jgi:hypothetical protein
LNPFFASPSPILCSRGIYLAVESDQIAVIMPRLRVVAGTSLDDLHPITVNTGTAHSFASDVFDGSVCAYIKDFPGPDGQPLESEYFARDDRKGITWSIQVQGAHQPIYLVPPCVSQLIPAGRFLQSVTADDVLFGNTFDRPLQLPWGSSAAFRFMTCAPTPSRHLPARILTAPRRRYIDPSLEHDLASKTKPWALSPLVSTMPHLAHTRGAPPPFPPPRSLADDVAQLHLCVDARSRSPSPASSTESVASSSSSSHGTSESHGSSAKSRISLGSVKARIKRVRASPGADADADADAQGIRGVCDARSRRAFFADAAHRRDVVFGPRVRAFLQQARDT